MKTNANSIAKLFKTADSLETLSKSIPSRELDSLEKFADEIGKAWSGSWLGYQSRVYYKDLKQTPPGARFSKEWGLTERYAGEDTRGDWVEYNFDDITSLIKSKAKIKDIDSLTKTSKVIKNEVEDHQANALSILLPILDDTKTDTYLADLVKKIQNEKIFSYKDFVTIFQPSGQQMSRDMIALQGGFQTPPHISILAEKAAIKSPYTSCVNLNKLIRRAASHIENLAKQETESNRIGTKVFIGHGRSPSWRELKDFIHDRMHLPWDEFNRIPVAGFANTARLSEMLNSAAIAFIIMTAEDEQPSGKMHARMNVIHEAGLFQGRLGFEKAILLVEEGCEEFSNVQGLGQIRFPKGKISAAFEEIRLVLERENLIG